MRTIRKESDGPNEDASSFDADHAQFLAAFDGLARRNHVHAFASELGHAAGAQRSQRNSVLIHQLALSVDVSTDMNEEERRISLPTPTGHMPS
jgi:hypothetical protein